LFYFFWFGIEIVYLLIEGGTFVAKFNRGQTVVTKKFISRKNIESGIIGLDTDIMIGSIICEDANNPNSWAVLIREKGKEKISFFEEQDLRHYSNICWKCSKKLKSNTDSSCLKCGWLYCPDCQCCKMPKCETIALEIEPLPIRLKSTR
jgi:hypothetical protein